jgi:hypothetical protein
MQLVQICHFSPNEFVDIAFPRIEVRVGIWRQTTTEATFAVEHCSGLPAASAALLGGILAFTAR